MTDTLRDAGSYRITLEEHISRETYYEGRTCPPRTYGYAIRRRDGSLVFRAETMQYAERLLARLISPQEAAE